MTTTTAQWIFDKAMALMDELAESTGAALYSDTREYHNRTLPILNTIRHECYLASDTWRVAVAGERPVVAEITDFDTVIGIDDGVAQGAMPYGLAAHLMLGENDTLADYFSQRYLELLAQLRVGIPAAWEDIPLAYGGI